MVLHFYDEIPSCDKQYVHIRYGIIIINANKLTNPSVKMTTLTTKKVVCGNLHLVPLPGGLKNGMKTSNCQLLDNIQEHGAFQTVRSEQNCQ